MPKAGTTALCEFLGRHPEVFMCPIKEPSFFAVRELLEFGTTARKSIDAKAAALERWLTGETPHRPHEGFALEWDRYEQLFRGVRDERAIGEGSMTYWWAPGAAPAIRDRFPDARIVVVLRDPADRLFSQYLATRWAAPLRTFRDCIDLALARRDSWDVVLDVGRYATHLERWFACFDREQISIHLYEDFCADPRRVCSEIFAFLGVGPDHAVDVAQRINAPLLPRWPMLLFFLRSSGAAAAASRWLPRAWIERVRTALLGPRAQLGMSARDRRVLVELYRDEIERTAALIGRDLSHWLR